MFTFYYDILTFNDNHYVFAQLICDTNSKGVNINWIMLDSQLAVGLFCNPELLKKYVKSMKN